MPIDLIDTIKPKNNGTFPMVEAEDVVVGKGTADEKRLPEALGEKAGVEDVAKTGEDNDFAQEAINLFRGVLRMANPRIAAAPDNASKDIALVPEAEGAGLQIQFPGGATVFIPMKTGTVPTAQDVSQALEDFQEQLQTLINER